MPSSLINVVPLRTSQFWVPTPEQSLLLSVSFFEDNSQSDALTDAHHRRVAVGADNIEAYVAVVAAGVDAGGRGGGDDSEEGPEEHGGEVCYELGVRGRWQEVVRR